MKNKEASKSPRVSSAQIDNMAVPKQYASKPEQNESVSSENSSYFQIFVEQVRDSVPEIYETLIEVAVENGFLEVGELQGNYHLETHDDPDLEFAEIYQDKNEKVFNDEIESILKEFREKSNNIKDKKALKEYAEKLIEIFSEKSQNLSLLKAKAEFQDDKQLGLEPQTSLDLPGVEELKEIGEKLIEKISDKPKNLLLKDTAEFQNYKQRRVVPQTYPYLPRVKALKETQEIHIEKFSDKPKNLLLLKDKAEFQDDEYRSVVPQTSSDLSSVSVSQTSIETESKSNEVVPSNEIRADSPTSVADAKLHKTETSNSQESFAKIRKKFVYPETQKESQAQSNNQTNIDKGSLANVSVKGIAQLFNKKTTENNSPTIIKGISHVATGNRHGFAGPIPVQPGGQTGKTQGSGNRR